MDAEKGKTMGAKNKFGAGIRLAVMAGCYFLAVRYSADVQDAARIVVVSFADGGATAETAESICEEERGIGQEQVSGQDQDFGQEQASGQGQDSGQKQESGQDQGFGQVQTPRNDQQQGQGSTLSLCFWREQEDLQFSCKETGQTAQATGLLTEGDPSLVARGSEILAWQEDGCVMDAVTAQELFGTQQANGQLVWCGGKAYTVYGTFESLERTVVLRTGAGSTVGNSAGKSTGMSTGIFDANSGLSSIGLSGAGFSDEGYDHLSIRVSEGANVKTEAEQLLMRYGLSGNIADLTFPGMVCGNLLLALPVLLAMGLMRILWSCLWNGKQQRSAHVLSDREIEYETATGQNDSGANIDIAANIDSETDADIAADTDNIENKNIDKADIVKKQNVAETKVPGKIACVAMLAGASVALFSLLRNHIQIPADMIPTRWSDFSFWTQWWTVQKANLLQILGSAQGEMQLEALWGFGVSVICSILAIGAGVSFLHTQK